MNLEPRNARLVYLITYSKVDLTVVPTREAFSTLAQEAFKNVDLCSTSNVLQWACSVEPYTSGGVHHHMAIKPDSLRRWLKIRNYLELTRGIKVNFSFAHVNYYSAWRYTTKDDG